MNCSNMTKILEIMGVLIGNYPKLQRTHNGCYRLSILIYNLLSE